MQGFFFMIIVMHYHCFKRFTWPKDKKKGHNLLNLIQINFKSVVLAFFFGTQQFTGHFYSCEHCFKHLKECRSRIQFNPHKAVKTLAITLRATEPVTLSISLQCIKQNILLQESCSRQENGICVYMHC